ncbi:MAG: hypothetical protein OXN17_20915 [Candidatus Poribacteria bacterium]|nr:hypothetical protein [Candidatus Poribacteria bacterium]MDE0506557.1 hypothetical protein [Candidatus Poribacteria bacterium]
MFGLGGSIFHAEDRMYPGSRYITHFEQWARTGHYDGKPGQVQLMHEVQNFDDLSSSGFGVGWYFLLGFSF